MQAATRAGFSQTALLLKNAELRATGKPVGSTTGVRPAASPPAAAWSSF